jgi:tetratricopeptide (TPR) repeat protein
MEGRIIRKTDKEIKVDIHGVLTSYYLDEVKSINGQEPDVYTPVVIQEEKKVLAPAQEKEALNKGLAYLDRQMYDEAIAEFTKAIELNSRFTEAYYDRGLTYYKKMEFNQAISDYTKAIEISPNDADVYYNRGLVYSLNKEYDKAWEDIHKAESLGYKVNPDFRKELQKVSKREN